MKKQFFALSMLILVGCNQGTTLTPSESKADLSSIKTSTSREEAIANAISNGGQFPKQETKKMKVDNPNKLVAAYKINLKVCGDLTHGPGCITDHGGEVLWGEVSEPKLINDFGIYSVAIKSGGCIPFFKTPQPPVYRLAEIAFTLKRDDSPKPTVTMTRKQMTELSLAEYVNAYNKTQDSGLSTMTDIDCKSVPPQKIH